MKLMENVHKFLVLDIGTTTIRCFVVNTNLKVLGSSFEKVQLLYPKEGCVEIDPNWLWDTIISTVKCALKDAKLTPSDIRSLGISVQRSTFITWKKDTGEHFHNFITWKDVRSRELVEKWNNSYSLKFLQTVCYVLHLVTRKKRFLAASKLNMSCLMVSIRLLWILENNENVRKELEKDNVMFGTLDTWLIYKLTNGRKYLTDFTNAATTAMYDLFDLKWSGLLMNMLKIPSRILPPVVENDFDFGQTDVFGEPSIKISTILGDQHAAMIGSCSFNENDMKITLGTGAFINKNTNDKVEIIFDGMYPSIGWKLKEKLVYITETPCNDCGSLIEWMKFSGFIKNVNDIDRILSENNDDYSTEDLFFIPAFSGLGPPFNNPKAGTGFIGITPTTSKDKMALAILESIVFRIGSAFQAMKENSNVPNKIHIDGGVSKNDFLCQKIADITNSDIVRAEFEEIAILGVLFTCGLVEKVWKDMNEFEPLKKVGKIFKPNTSRSEYLKSKMLRWCRAVDRFESWHH